MASRNALCKRDKTARNQPRQHKYTQKVDGKGRKFISCDVCGNVPVRT